MSMRHQQMPTFEDSPYTVAELDARPGYDLQNAGQDPKRCFGAQSKLDEDEGLDGSQGASPSSLSVEQFLDYRWKASLYGTDVARPWFKLGPSSYATCWSLSRSSELET